MKITVKDCLELDVFKNYSKVVAGKNGLNKKVKTVSVLDAGDVETAIKNNGFKEELVLTSFYAMSGETELQKETVRALSKENISGLVLFNIKSIKDSNDYQDLIDLANDEGLPLIFFEENTPIRYSDIIGKVMDKIIYGDNFKSDLVNDAIYQLMNFEKYPEFTDAVKSVCHNHNINLTLLSKDFNKVLNIATEKDILIAHTVALLREYEGECFEMPIPAVEEGKPIYCGVIKAGDEKYYLIVSDENDKYTMGELNKFSEIIELAIGMWKFTPNRDYKSDIIKAMLRRNKNLVHTFKEELKIEDKQIACVFFGQNLDKIVLEENLIAFEEKNNCEIYRIEEEDKIYAIIVRNDVVDSDLHEYKQKCLKLFDTLKEGNKNVRIYHSTGVKGLEGATDDFRLILETCSYVAYVFPFKRVFSKYELVLVLACITMESQGPYVKKSFMELLEAFFQELGENKARQLLDTLETFVLDAGMNSNKTSEILGIHTNTVQYRLKRINEILGADITGNRVIPGLTVALSLRRLDKGMKQEL